MKRPEETRRELVRDWLKKSEDDLGLAKHLIKERSPYLNAIGFNAQQAAGKILKALLVRQLPEPPPAGAEWIEAYGSWAHGV